MSDTTIGFIGLGRMGGPMAANLVSAGYSVRGFDVIAAATEAAAAAGVTIVQSAADAALGATVVITMLPSGAHVHDCYDGPDGLIARAEPGTLLIDSSTIDVFDARSLHAAAVAGGHRQIDAPVSGGVMGASAGTLTFMVGGSEDDVAAAAPLFEVMGKRHVHCGPAGNGQAAKVCNNMILGISMIAVSEAFVLAERLGLSDEALYDVASTSSGQCWALTTNCPVPGPVPGSPANRDWEAGFAVDLMLKDLNLAGDAVAASGAIAELGQHATEIYTRLAAEGAGRKDFSAIYTSIRDAASAANDVQEVHR